MFDYVRDFGGNSDDVVEDISVDAAGNIIVVGTFKSTADLDPGSGAATFSSISVNDSYISKYSPDGTFLWTAPLLGWAGSNNTIKSVTTDAAGYIYACGHFNGTVDFDPSSGGSLLQASSSGSDDIFIVRLDIDGNFSWAKFIGGANQDLPVGIEYWDPTGNLYLTGFFSGTVDFDPGAGTTYLFGGALSDVFVLKLDLTAGFVWAKKMGGVGTDMAYDLCLNNSGHVISVGRFDALGSFDPDGGLGDLTPLGGTDIYVSNLSPDGSYVWAVNFTGSGGDVGYDVETDIANSVFVTGLFAGVVDFDPVGTATLTAAGPADAFVCKLDEVGNYQWASSFGGGGDDRGYSMVVTPASEVILSGWMTGSGTFFPGGETISGAGGLDGFTCHIDASGNFVWGFNTGSTGSDQLFTNTVTPDGKLLIGGRFQGTVDFDPGPAVVDSSAVSGWDACFMQFHQCFDSYNTIDVYECTGSYVGPSGFSYTTPGTHVDFSPNAMGCDSVLTINLTLNVPVAVDLFPVVCDSFISPSGLSIYYDSGIYTDLFTTAGCDTSYTIYLTVGAPGDTITVQACESFSSPGGTQVWTTSGTYNDTLTSATGCDSIVVVYLTITGLPTLFAGDDTTLCQGDFITLYSSGGSLTYSWSGGISDGVPFIPPVTTVNYILTGTDSDGCVNTDTVTLFVNPKPYLTVSGSQNFCPDDTLILYASGADSTIWQGGLSYTDSLVIAPKSDVTIVVEGITNGCSSFESIDVKMLACPVVAGNVITPNGDGLNDFLEILGIENFDLAHVVIFNRWGDVVFETDAYDNNLVRWEGKHGTTDLPTGTYFYGIRFDDDKFRKGYVQVIK